MKNNIQNKTTRWKKTVLNASLLLVTTSLLLVSCESLTGGITPPEQTAASDKYRLVWNDDPTSTVTIIWDQLEGETATVFYGTADCGRAYWKYPNQQRPTRRLPDYLEMNTCFAELENLEADQTYYAVIRDHAGVSPRFYFKTAPDRPVPFTFIAGGDSKSDGPALEAGRASNRMVANLRPLFVQYNGDFTSGDGTNPQRWHQWLSDWDRLTTTDDGQKFPIVPVHGNHENGDRTLLNKIFNAPFQQNMPDQIYYALSFGGGFFHTIVLNSEVDPGAHQGTWLKNNLEENAHYTFKIAGYHRPFAPHTTLGGKQKAPDLYDQWADLFYTYGLDLSMDADAHLHKITCPLKPSQSDDAVDGFVRDDETGTVFIGEGSWGASPRPVNAAKPWTLQSGSFNQFKWIHVHPETDRHPACMELFTVITSRIDGDGKQTFYVDDVESLTEDNRFELPEQIHLFSENGMQSVKIPFGLN